MTKRFINKGEFNAEIQRALALELIKSGKVKCKKDLCKYRICPVMLCRDACFEKL